MIRNMEPDDVNILIEIWLSASIAAHHFIDPDFWRQNAAVMRDVYLPNSRTWVVEVHGEVVGFCSLVDATLAAIFVAPDHQGKGSGSCLLDHVKSLCPHIQLAVYAENRASRKFYEKHGFVVVRERLDEHTGHPELLMEWKA